jgi:hypothetical protein
MSVQVCSASGNAPRGSLSAASFEDPQQERRAYQTTALEDQESESSESEGK